MLSLAGVARLRADLGRPFSPLEEQKLPSLQFHGTNPQHSVSIVVDPEGYVYLNISGRLNTRGIRKLVTFLKQLTDNN